jgi:hypothetical protein
MTCLRCGNEVPPGELMCNCFVTGGGATVDLQGLR